MKKKLIAGNWKMNGSTAANAALVQQLLEGVNQAACNIAVCVPAPYLAGVGALVKGTAIAVGAQDVSAHEAGAYTGEVSAGMLRDLAVRYVIVGHSERRQYHGETDAVVANKVQKALAAGIVPIVCVPWPKSSHGSCISYPQGLMVSALLGLGPWIASCQL